MALLKDSFYDMSSKWQKNSFYDMAMLKNGFYDISVGGKVKLPKSYLRYGYRTLVHQLQDDSKCWPRKTKFNETKYI